ncbi:cytosine deaminase [Niallia sp. Krafla_26]|uniref:cytosine deaminase n=1 Tax=Niallia sp. Krafla_26 TaxID=3064703 RepID=UPI003D185A1D
MKKLYKNVHLKGKKEAVDLYVENGVFKEIGPNLQVECEEVIDMDGHLAVPPYVDPHIHLDYVYTARKEGATNDTGTLFEGIQRWSETKNDLTVEEIKERAKRAIKAEVLQGVQFIRTHADVTDPNLTALKALLELREELKDIVTIQIVSFPQEGMYAYKGGAELVEEGLKMGADCVGGIPHFEFAREFGEKSVHTTIDLALKYDKMIDVHCDETDDEQSRYLELLATLAYMEGIGEKTAASHTCAMGSYNNAYAFKLMKVLGLSNINFIVCPTENLYLQGRYDTYPKRRGITRVKEINEAGMNICFAQDSIEDPWYPAGSGNLMNVLDNGIHAAQMMTFEEMDNALDLITVNGAKTMMLTDKYGIEVGKPANFIVLNAKTPFDAVVRRVSVAASVRNGDFLFRRAPEVIDTNLNYLKVSQSNVGKILTPAY